MRLSDFCSSAYSVHLFLCRSTKSCKVIESSKLSQALFISTQTSRVVHSLLWVQNPGSSTQATGAVEPSATSMISVSHISEGGRASVNPPQAPRVLFTRPADLRGMKSCSRYPLPFGDILYQYRTLSKMEGQIKHSSCGIPSSCRKLHPGLMSNTLLIC